MKNSTKKLRFSILSIFSLVLFISCNNDDDAITNPGTTPVITDPDPSGTVVLDNEINQFIFESMWLWYLWDSDVPEFADGFFEDQDEYFTHLNSFSSPVDVFNDITISKDRFSGITDNYDLLFNSLAGVFKSNGLEFTLTAAPEGLPKVVGFVRYVVNGSDASTKNIKRGDFFYAVNGIELYYNNASDNNLNLLDPDSYTVNLADIDVNTLTTIPNGENVELTKSELVENPIHVSKTLDVNGTKIGYLMYNQFVRDGYNEQLNEVFAQFNADGITEFVLDLRYNSGGSTLTAIHLASLITGQFNDQLFYKETWNTKWNDILSTENNFVDEFANGGGALNSINMNRIYVLATDETASASELIINGLTPYIDVIHIGDTTLGKNEFSVSLVDKPDQGEQIPPYVYVGEESLEGVNPDHKYAMQLLAGTNENAAGFSDYTLGLTPDIELQEIITQLGELGDPEEPLLAKAIEEITGVSSRKKNIKVSERLKVKTLKSSKDYTLTKDNMYWDFFKK